MIWLWLAAATMALVAIVHSVVGERRMIGPLLALDTGVMARPQSRRVLRFAWHLTSVLMLVSALLVVWPGTAPALIALTGAAWLGCGLVDAAMTRGRHFGWPAIAAAGAFALLGSGR